MDGQSFGMVLKKWHCAVYCFNTATILYMTTSCYNLTLQTLIILSVGCIIHNPSSTYQNALTKFLH